ncbi:MAG: tetratricopeptide repeat protein [Acidobacteria bacterium]|nr:tetratricopeptide repeat protein [Acidobacteriota bacterium]
MRTALLASAVFAAAFTAHAQDPSAIQRDFEAGRYQQVVDAAGPDAEPSAVYIAVLSAQKLDAGERPAELARRLTDRPDDDPWHFVGLSLSQLLDAQLDAALEAARRAVDLGDQLPEGHYQLGLVLARRQDWRPAAAAFDRAAELSPKFAHAYYYGGLMHSRANRPDLMAVRFEQFLKLAPDAPERPEVLQIMRTIRGK